MSARKLITPIWSSGLPVPDRLTVDAQRATLALADLCATTVAAVRFDASSLPVTEIRFTADVWGVLLEVDIEVPNREAEGPIVVTRSRACLWASVGDPDYLVRFLRETITNILAHEADECLTLYGRRVFDLHASLVPT